MNGFRVFIGQNEVTPPQIPQQPHVYTLNWTNDAIDFSSMWGYAQNIYQQMQNFPPRTYPAREDRNQSGTDVEDGLRRRYATHRSLNTTFRVEANDQDHAHERIPNADFHTRISVNHTRHDAQHRGESANHLHVFQEIVPHMDTYEEPHTRTLFNDAQRDEGADHFHSFEWDELQDPAERQTIIRTDHTTLGQRHSRHGRGAAGYTRTNRINRTATTPSQKRIEDNTIRYKYQKIHRNGREVGETCSVCICDIATDEDARRLPCMHLYHVACVDSWLLKQPHCPVCRIKITN